MSPTLTLLLLLLQFQCIQNKSCNRRPFDQATKVTGIKSHFEPYPWHVFEPIRTRVSFLRVHLEESETIPQLCRHSLPANLTEYLLIKLGVSQLEPGVFDVGTRVLSVRLDENQLSTIKKGVFNRSGIVSLVLAFNLISTIEPEAFEGMRYLEALSLEGNHLKHFDITWFKHSLVLYELNFQSNVLEELPKNVTGNLVGYQKTTGYLLVLGHLNFDNNRIRFVHPEAFSGLKRFGSISLSNNLLEEVPEKSFGNLTFLFSLYLNDNRVVCVSNGTLSELAGVHRLLLGRNPLESKCAKEISMFFYQKDDVVFF